jgi:hypothetical protein
MRASWTSASAVAAAKRLKAVQFRTMKNAIAPAPAPATIAAHSHRPSR